ASRRERQTSTRTDQPGQAQHMPKAQKHKSTTFSGSLYVANSAKSSTQGRRTVAESQSQRTRGLRCRRPPDNHTLSTGCYFPRALQCLNARIILCSSKRSTSFRCNWLFSYYMLWSILLAEGGRETSERMRSVAKHTRIPPLLQKPYAENLPSPERVLH